MPDVVESAVVAKPSEEWGETPWAFVVRRADSERVEEDIRLDANKRLSPFRPLPASPLWMSCLEATLEKS